MRGVGIARRPVLPIGLGALLVLTAALATVGAPASFGAGSRVSTALPPLLHHGNVSANLTRLAGTGAPGVEVEIGFVVSAVGAGPDLAGSSVEIPPMFAELPVQNGSLALYFRATNVTLNASGAAGGTLGPAVRFSPGFVLDGNRSGLVSSQGLSVLTSWAEGTHALGIAWRWVLVAPDGSTSTSGWSATTDVVPAQIAFPAPGAAKTWTLGSPNLYCLNGPIGGRAFTLRIAIASPPAVVILPTATSPLGVDQLCWNSTLPGGVTAQAASLHLWEVTNTTYLLAASNIQLVAPDQGAGGSIGPATFAGLGPWLPLAVVAGVGIVGTELFLLLRSRSSPGHPSTLPPSGVFAPAPTFRPPPPGVL